jgi:hypothetical protein
MSKAGEIKEWITANSDRIAYPLLRTPDGRIWWKHNEFETREQAEAQAERVKMFYSDAKILDLYTDSSHKVYVYATRLEKDDTDNEPVFVIRVKENDKVVTLNCFTEEEKRDTFKEIAKRKLQIISTKSVPFQKWKQKDKTMKKGGGIRETIFLDPAVHINMDNYKPYSGIRELREKAKAFLLTIIEREFSLEETNPQIKFVLNKKGASHIMQGAGITKLIITKQLPAILKQGSIFGVEDEEKGDVNTLHILKCRTHIMIENKMYEFYFVLKMKRDTKTYLYDGTINLS